MSDYSVSSSEDESRLSSAIGALKKKEAEARTEIESGDDYYDDFAAADYYDDFAAADYDGSSSFHYQSPEDERQLSSAIGALKKRKAEVRTEIEQGDDYNYESWFAAEMGFLIGRSARVQQLSSAFVALNEKEAEIRLGLRSRGGHRGKVDNKVLVWLEEFEKIKNHLSDLTKQPSKYFLPKKKKYFFCLPYVNRSKEVVQLINEVKFLTEEASSFQVIRDSNDEDRVQGVQPSQPLFGKLAQEVSDRIWNYLMDPKIGTICLYGSGGVGKTTIMKNIKNQLANTDIFDKIIWVTLSKNLDMRSVQDDIAKQLNINLPKASEWKRSQIIFHHLWTVNRCLIILDDLWPNVWLHELGIPYLGGDKGCKIVVTTRFRGFLTNWNVSRWMHLSPLSENEAWELFVSRSGDHVLGPDINIFAKELVNECEGLPLTVITVAHAMRDEVDPTAWRHALTSLQKNVRGEAEDDVFSLLEIGYNHLKNNQIRECFLYCALFPEDYKFDANELIGYWMAEDFIHNENDVARSYDEGLEILRYLKDASMLEMSVEGGNEQWQMHDLFRDLAIRILSEVHGCFVRAGQGLTSFPHISEYAAAKKISVVRNHIESLDSVRNCSNLSTLLLKDNPLSNIRSSDFLGMRNLQVIDMSFTWIKDLPYSLCLLAKLRVLLLQYCTSLTKIRSLKELKELRVLNLRGTLITELPHGMEHLVSLRSLDLSETVRLKYIRTGVLSSLLNLEELQMQGSGLCKMQSKTVRKCFKEIRCLKKLGILSLSAVGFEDHLDTILFLQGYSLKRFSINVYGSSSDYVDDVL